MIPYKWGYWIVGFGGVFIIIMGFSNLFLMDIKLGLGYLIFGTALIIIARMKYKHDKNLFPD